MDLEIRPGSIAELEAAAEPEGGGKKVRKLKTDGEPSGTSGPAAPAPGWTAAALPGSAIPDVRKELGVLLQGVDLKPISEKPATIIVPTVFPGLNRATRIGGVPVSCVCCIHGPSKGGKTAFCLGLVQSFQLQGHFAVYVDAEHTLDKTFVSNCNVDTGQMEYLAPMSYEETTQKVEKLINNLRKGRDNGRIHPNRCLLIIVDSLTKLVPENELEKLSEVGKGFPLRALMNTAWLDKLTPHIGTLPILFVVLAHEKVKIDAKPFEKKYRVKGGESLIFDSTMAIRVSVVGSRKVQVDGKRVEVAIVHKGVIEKSKVGICHEQFIFTMGMGKEGYPVGIDPVDSILEEAKLRGSGCILSRGTGGLWEYPGLPGGKIRGDGNLIEYLRANPDLVDTLIRELNETAINAVVEEDSGDVEGEESGAEDGTDD